MELQKVFADPRMVVLPLPTQSHPDWRGKTLGEILAEDPEEGQRLLDFLANGYNGPFHLKLAAALILAESRKWGPFAGVQRSRKRKTTAGMGKKKAEDPIRLTKGLLQAAVGVAGRFVPRRASLPVLEHILVVQDGQGLTLRATDLEAGVEVRIPTLDQAESVVGLIPKKALVAAVKAPRAAVKREVVGFSPALAKMYGLTLNTPQGQVVLMGMDPVEAPPKKEVGEDTPRYTLPLPLLTTAAMAAAGDDARPILTGVSINHQEGGTLAAADGYRLFYTEIDLPAEFPDILIPRSVVENAGKIFAAGDVDLACSLEDRPEHVTSGHVVLTGEAKDKALAAAGARIQVWANLIAGNFPEVKTVVKDLFDLPHMFQVQSQALLDGLTSLRATINEANLIYLVVENGVLTLVAHSADFGEQTIQVPIRQFDEKATYVACNIRYLEDAVKSIKNLAGEEVALRLWPLDEKGRPQTRAFGVSDPEDRFRWAIMPMHAAEDYDPVRVNT